MITANVQLPIGFWAMGILDMCMLVFIALGVWRRD